MYEGDLVRTLEQWVSGKVREVLETLQASGKAQLVQRFNTQFWGAAPSHYPDDTHSRAVDLRGRH
jgi:uncharacterized glyoxalase superfamily protein PhnB